MSSRQLIDLSHPITAGMTTFPGLPGPEITEYLSHAASRGHYAPGTEFAIHRVSMVGNTGTYLDSPYHRYADGVDLAGLPLTAVADLPVVVVRATGGERAVGAEAVAAAAVEGCAVLVHTGWDRHWGTAEYGQDAPFLTADAAGQLVEAGVALVGIDAVNVDDATDASRPVHSALLGAGVPVLEHLTNLGQLPSTGARLHAVPAPVAGCGTFPVRAYAILPR